MVLDISRDTVPEELYNLTQLADVTLAAGKISFNPEPSAQNNMASNIAHYNNSSGSLNCEIGDNKYVYDNYRIQNNIDNYIDESNNGEVNKLQSKSSTAYRNQRDENMLSKNLSSSEDDSSNFNYSHKIFDKRKSRPCSYQSDDSESNNYKLSRQMGYFLKTNITINDDKDDGFFFSENELSDDFLDSNFNQKQNVTSDLSSTDEGVHTCPDCGKKYSTSSNLARHRQTHRSLMDKKARRCPHCDKVYVSMPAFSMHVRTHNQGCACPHCGKRFSRPWLLQGHIRTHTGEKPFQCLICTKAFADKSNLRAHVQTHSNSKPHVCRRCGKSFALKSYLYKHEDSSCLRNRTKQTINNIYKFKKHASTKNGSKKKWNDSKIVNEKINKAIEVPPFSSNQLVLNDLETIFMDEKSEKSYVNLKQMTNSLNIENCTRISVIKSIQDNSTTVNSNEQLLCFLQEKPVDFSPRNLYPMETLCNKHSL